MNDPIIEGYGGQPPHIDNPPNLPFTGLDLWVVIIGAVLILTTGMMLRRRSKR